MHLEGVFDLRQLKTNLCHFSGHGEGITGVLRIVLGKERKEHSIKGITVRKLIPRLVDLKKQSQRIAGSLPLRL